MRKGFLVVHKWLGLITGVVVFIVAITGCFYAFKDEIQSLYQGYKHVEVAEDAWLTPSEVAHIADSIYPEQHIHSINYLGKDKALEVIYYEDHTDTTELIYDAFYIHPTTGESIKYVDLTSGFFRFILDGHYYLWLPEELGHTVVATSTLIFFFMLITGLILWWPKNKNARKQRFKFKWKETTKWKRKNYDLHNILGFYVISIAMVLSLTGLVWGFSWFAYGSYTLLGGEKSMVYVEPDSPSLRNQAALPIEQMENNMDEMWRRMMLEYPKAANIEVHVPHTDSSTIYISIQPDEGTYYRTDYRFFDQKTLEEVEVNHLWGKYADADATDKLFRMNYDIHIGAIAGLPGKIIAFLASLIISSLPVTGTLVWWGRRKKKKKSKGEESRDKR